MQKILEKKIPTELTMNILKFCRHPVAELILPLIDIHDYHKDGYRTYCEGRNLPDKSQELEFPMIVFMDRRIEKGRKSKIDQKTVVCKNRDLISRYC